MALQKAKSKSDVTQWRAGLHHADSLL